MAFNTGNPVPSGDARDLSDNAENLDSAVNSTGATWTDRLGVVRKTVTSSINSIDVASTQGLIDIEADVAAVNASADAFEVLALQRLNELGVIYDSPIRDWSASLLVDDLRAHRYPATTGDIYIPTKALPFTTGATFDAADWVILQGVTPADIANNISIVKVHQTVAAFKADLTEYPDGKIIHLNDRDADFTKITGTGTGNNANIIASTGVNQSIQLSTASNKVYAKAWGCLKNQDFDNAPILAAMYDFLIAQPSPVNVFNGANDVRGELFADDGWYQLSTQFEVDKPANGIVMKANLYASATFPLSTPMLRFPHTTGPTNLPYHYLGFDLRLDGRKRAAGLEIFLSNRCWGDITATGCKGFAARIGDPTSPPAKGHEFVMRNFEAGFSEWSDPNRVADRSNADGYQLEIYDPDGHYFNTIIYDGDKGLYNNSTSNTFSVGHIWGLAQPDYGMSTLGDNPMSQMYFDDTAIRLRNGGKNVQMDGCQWYNSGAETLTNFVIIESDVAGQKIEKFKISGSARNTNGAHTVQFFGLDTTNGAFNKAVTKDLDFNISTTGMIEGYKHEIESGVTNALAEKVVDINTKTDLALNLVDEVNLISGIPVQQNTYTFIKWHIVDRVANNEFSLAADIAWTGEFKYRATVNRQ